MISLRYQILSLPFCALLFLIAIIAIFLLTLVQQQRLLNGVNGRHLASAHELVHAFSDLTDAHADVRALLAPAADKLDEEQVYEKGAGLSDKMQLVERQIVVAADKFDGNEDERQLVALIKREVQSFRQSVTTALEISTVDVQLATSRLAKANASYAEFSNAILKLVDPAVEQSQLGISQLVEITDHRFNGVIVVAIGLVAALSGLLILILPKLMWRLQRILIAMRRLGEGDIAVDLSDVQRGDEIGEVAQSVQIFRDNEIGRRQLLEDSEKDQKTRAIRQKTVDSLIGHFRDEAALVLAEVAANADRMQATAKALSGVATQTSSQASGAGNASREALQNVQAVAVATRELSISIHEISGQVSQTSLVVSRAASAAETSNAKITGLAEAAEKIGDVVSLIRMIAEQTNLLALNATIEAARAGAAGRGFAVVATEVKQLATQTGKATEEIGAQIASIQKATCEVVGTIRMITETMRDVTASTATIAAAVEQQGTSTTTIFENVQHAASGADEMLRSIGAMTAAAAETSQASDQVLSASNDVSANTRTLRTAVDGFLERVSVA